MLFSIGSWHGLLDKCCYGVRKLCNFGSFKLNVCFLEFFLHLSDTSVDAGEWMMG